MIENSLSIPERDRFDVLEDVIEHGLQTFVDVGEALLEIRDGRLYREEYSSFEDYCQDRWGMTRNRSDQLISAAKTIPNLTTMVVKPSNERQTRPLTKLEPDQQRQAWQQAVETAPDGKITAKHVQETVDRFRGKHLLIHQSNNNEWYTPKQYLESARLVMGDIDLDPASSPEANRIVGAIQYLTEKDNGLSHDWYGRVWLNPPYGGIAGKFIEKLIDEVNAGKVIEAIVLVNSNSTETKWFRPLWDHLLCFTDHRINFDATNGSGDTGSTHGSVFIYIGKNDKRFYDHFNQWGIIVRRVDSDYQE